MLEAPGRWAGGGAQPLGAHPHTAKPGREMHTGQRLIPSLIFS